MQRWILAMAVLLGGAISVAHADYLRIIYNLQAARADQTQAGTLPGVLPPGNRPPGEMPLPPGPGGPPGKGGPPAPTPPPAPRPNPPQNPTPPPGPPGGRPLPPIFGKLLARLDDEEERVIEASVVVEYNKADSMLGLDVGVRYDRIHHKWGATALHPALPDIRIEFVTEDGNKVPTVAQRYALQRQIKLKGSKSPESILELAEWTLQHADIADTTHRMFDEFVKLMGELRELDKNHRVLKAFDKVQTDIDASVSGGDDSAIIWKDRLDHFKVKRSKHYTLLYDASDGESADVDVYLDQLEENMRGFFYWFALKGHAIPVPTRRLVAVLVRKPEEFQSYRNAFDNAGIVADGFYSPRDNLAVFCSTRQDEAYSLLITNTAPLWLAGWNQADLLKGKANAVAKTSEENVKNQMLALLLKAMSEESVRASISHEGTRQLLLGTGLLNQQVETPEWIQFGTGAFFETPVGAYWPGMGAPHWTHMVKFKLWNKPIEVKTPDNKVVGVVREIDPADAAIRSVITDKYFREARAEDKKSLETKARTMSWSLAYFLMNKKLEGVLRYYQELRDLPRDMVPDDDALIGCFGRAFELMQASDPTRIDDRKLNGLADQWYSYIELTPMESSEALQEAWRNLKTMADKSKTRAAAKPTDKKPTAPGVLPPKPPTSKPGEKKP